MTLLVLGINHRSAPLAVLDQVGLSQDEADGLAVELTSSDAVAEAMVLATCNRVEVYVDAPRFHPAVAAVGESLAKWTGVSRATLLEHSYVHFDSAAVAHLFTVAVGLESMVVGEGQILGQLRASLTRAQEAATAGRSLNGVVQPALRVGKRVHAETGIDRCGVSIVSVALEAAGASLGSLAGVRTMVVGAGSMGGLTVATLQARGAGEILVVNRTRAGADRLAADLTHARALGLSELAGALAEVDLVVCCTGAQDTVLDVDTVRRARRGGAAGRPLVVLDLALPHDVEPEVDALPGVQRIDLDDIARFPGAAASERDVAAARQIVADEVDQYLADLAAQQVEPVLVSLRAHAGGVLDAEMSRLRLKLGDLDPAQLHEVERALRRAVACLLHEPTVRMKQLASGPGGQRYAEALSVLFDLDPSLPASVLDPGADTSTRGAGTAPGHADHGSRAAAGTQA